MTNRVIYDIAKRNGADYVDFTDILCSNGYCSGVVNGDFIYYDVGHISKTGSEQLGEAIRPKKNIIEKFSLFADR